MDTRRLPRGDADHGRVRRHVAHDDRIGAERAPCPTVTGPSTLRAGADDDIGLDGRVALAVGERRAAERDVMVDGDVVADDRCFADDDAQPVVDEEALADHRAGVGSRCR
ncbi:MAG: hypothetical protein WDN72_05585 [Alphaproteobacteria bacterium]